MGSPLGGGTPTTFLDQLGRAKAWVNAASTFACVAGVAALIGWQFRIELLKAPFSNSTFMAPTTALCLILLGLSLGLQREQGRGVRSRSLGKLCAAFVFVFGSLTVAEYATGLDFGFDRLFFAHRLSDWTLSSTPGRVATNTALAFVLLALALLLLDKEWKEQPLSEILSLAASLIAFLGLIGYWYGVPYLSGVTVANHFVLRMALQTSITFLVLSTGVFFARTDDGLAAMILGRDISGVIARRLLITIVFVLPVLGWLRVKAEAAGIVGPEFGTVLLVCVSVTLFSILTLDTARRLRRQNLEREFIEDRRLLAAVVESTDDAIYTKSLDGVFTSWNKGAERLYGYTPAEAIGQSVILVSTPENPQEMWDLLQRIRRGERVEHHESVRMCKDGRRVDVWVTLSPLKGNDGKVTGASAIVRDITEFKRVNEEIRKLNASLEQRVLDRTAELTASNKELEAFTYSVSHDLRAPLRHIDGFSKMLLEKYHEQLDTKGQHYLEEVRTGTRNMGRLVDELLTLSRVGRQEPQLQLTGLNAVFEDVRAELMKDFGDRQIELNIKSLPFLECDPTLMRQVAMNLLSNAVKYTRPRERAVIEVGQIQRGRETVVYVRDNGVGFSMKYADKLFGVFQRLHRAEDFEGTGVGLAMVQRIITKHNGRVWAEAELNEGATFFFTLREAQTDTIPLSATAVEGTHA
jgi:PAS domain S-box-containing protein